MSLQNRVTPLGEIIANPARGTLMGNRGCLHDGQQRVVRAATRDAWITCRQDWKGIRRQLMAPGNYTELFFLDEATALAAGHRPCGECRGEQLRGFQGAWAAGVAGVPGTRTLVGDIDTVLKSERRIVSGQRITYRSMLGELPDGAMIVRSGLPLLKWQGHLHRWSPARYTGSEVIDPGSYADVLTPPSIVRVLQAGYVPGVHSSAHCQAPTAFFFHSIRPA